MGLQRLRMFFGILIIALLVGCGGEPAPPQVIVNRPPVPTALSTASVLVGQAVGNTTQLPIKKTYVYLAKVYWDKEHKNAAYAVDLAHSPVAQTDQNGFFTFIQLEPSEYVIVVGDYYGSNDVVREKNGDAQIYKPELGKTLDVGVVQVSPNVSPGS